MFIDDLEAWGLTDASRSTFRIHAYTRKGNVILLPSAASSPSFPCAWLDEKMAQLADILARYYGEGWFIVRDAELDIHVALVEFGPRGYTVHPCAQFWHDQLGDGPDAA